VISHLLPALFHLATLMRSTSWGLYVNACHSAPIQTCSCSGTVNRDGWDVRDREIVWQSYYSLAFRIKLERGYWAEGGFSDFG
jgi:hypothetical protein